MADPQPFWFDGTRFPLWVLINAHLENTVGESLATHCLTDNRDGSRVLLFFVSEELANQHAAQMSLIGYRNAEIHDAEDLLIRLELFPKNKGTYVGIEDATEPEDRHIHYPIDGFIEFVRAGIKK
jgi:hypothetical protein